MGAKLEMDNEQQQQMWGENEIGEHQQQMGAKKN